MKTPVTLHITDHALLRYAERHLGLDLEKTRAEMQVKAQRAATAAMEIGGGRYLIAFDDLRFRCHNDRVVTVVTGDPERDNVD